MAKDIIELSKELLDSDEYDFLQRNRGVAPWPSARYTSIIDKLLTMLLKQQTQDLLTESERSIVEMVRITCPEYSEPKLLAIIDRLAPKPSTKPVSGWVAIEDMKARTDAVYIFDGVEGRQYRWAANQLQTRLCINVDWCVSLAHVNALNSENWFKLQ